jgi:lysozyme
MTAIIHATAPRRAHVDAYDQQRHGHNVDVREHYRSRPGAGGWYDGADLGVPAMRYKAINLGLRTLVEPKPEVLRALGLTLDDLVVREKRPLRRQNFEAKAAPAAARADTQVTSPHAATKVTDASKRTASARGSKQPGYLTADGKPIHLPVRASQYVKDNATTNKLPQAMKPSEELVDEITKLEGRNINPSTGKHDVYRDEAGRPTIGYGHLLKEGENFAGGITEDQARYLLEKGMKDAIAEVNRSVKVAIPQGMYDALVLLAFNVGSIRNSKLVAAMNRGDFDAASLEFRDWNNVTRSFRGEDIKRPSDGLEPRRDCRRQFGLSHAACFCSLSIA